MKVYSTKQACQQTGATPRQLRYWAYTGLVTPSVQDTGGRPGIPRIWTEDDVDRLRYIVGMIRDGVSVQKIRSMMPQQGDG